MARRETVDDVRRTRLKKDAALGAVDNTNKAQDLRAKARRMVADIDKQLSAVEGKIGRIRQAREGGR